MIAGPGPPGPAPYKRRRPYDRLTNRPTGRFAIVDGPQIDGSQECDGASITHEFLPGYPKGLLVVHDGDNTPDVGRTNTNFKFVPLR